MRTYILISLLAPIYAFGAGSTLEVIKDIDTSKIGFTGVSGLMISLAEGRMTGTAEAQCSLGIDQATAGKPLLKGDELNVTFLKSVPSELGGESSVLEMAEEIIDLGGYPTSAIIVSSVKKVIPDVLSRKADLFEDADKVKSGSLIIEPVDGIPFSDFTKDVLSELSEIATPKEMREVKRQIKLSIAREVVDLGGAFENEALEMSEYTFKAELVDKERIYSLNCIYHTGVAPTEVLESLINIQNWSSIQFKK